MMLMLPSGCVFFIQSHAVTWHRFKTRAFQMEDVICVAVPLSEMRNAFVLNRSCVNYMLLLNAHRGFITYIAELNKCVSGLTLINPVHRLLRCHGKHCWQTGNIEAIFFFFSRRAAFNSQQQKYQRVSQYLSQTLSCAFNRKRISCHRPRLWRMPLKCFLNCKIHHVHVCVELWMSHVIPRYLTSEQGWENLWDMLACLDIKKNNCLNKLLKYLKTWAATFWANHSLQR